MRPNDMDADDKLARFFAKKFLGEHTFLQSVFVLRLFITDMYFDSPAAPTHSPYVQPPATNTLSPQHDLSFARSLVELARTGGPGSGRPEDSWPRHFPQPGTHCFLL